ncbi:hypothetical protein PMIN01_01476 [Paraphaeosphaeria minitans]|uniref:Uncharacterized protein n=1 Tax=Paraphaeosphaeria minitans TaxID=565426 RepID=A0A9P6KWX2_9PLEO|nr:hypothetical protein PMIN01_01476 [Paraphaeosphaeria minitans]
MRTISETPDARNRALGNMVVWKGWWVEQPLHGTRIHGTTCQPPHHLLHTLPFANPRPPSQLTPTHVVAVRYDTETGLHAATQSLPPGSGTFDAIGSCVDANEYMHGGRGRTRYIIISIARAGGGGVQTPMPSMPSMPSTHPNHARSDPHHATGQAPSTPRVSGKTWAAGRHPHHRARITSKLTKWVATSVAEPAELPEGPASTSLGWPLAVGRSSKHGCTGRAQCMKRTCLAACLSQSIGGQDD